MAYLNEVKPYVLILGADFIRAEMQTFLDQQGEVTYWYACLPNCIFLTAKIDAQQLSNRIHAQFPKRQFLVALVTNDKQGWLMQQAWHLLNNPNNPVYPKK